MSLYKIQSQHTLHEVTIFDIVNIPTFEIIKVTAIPITLAIAKFAIRLTRRMENSKMNFKSCFTVDEELKEMIAQLISPSIRTCALKKMDKKSYHDLVKAALDPTSTKNARVFIRYDASDRQAFIDEHGLLSDIPLVVQFNADFIFRFGYIDENTMSIHWLQGWNPKNSEKFRKPKRFPRLNKFLRYLYKYKI